MRTKLWNSNVAKYAVFLSIVLSCCSFLLADEPDLCCELLRQKISALSTSDRQYLTGILNESNIDNAQSLEAFLTAGDGAISGTENTAVQEFLTILSSGVDCTCLQTNHIKDLYEMLSETKTKFPFGFNSLASLMQFVMGVVGLYIALISLSQSNFQEAYQIFLDRPVPKLNWPKIKGRRITTGQVTTFIASLGIATLILEIVMAIMKLTSIKYLQDFKLPYDNFHFSLILWIIFVIIVAPNFFFQWLIFIRESSQVEDEDE